MFEKAFKRLNRARMSHQKKSLPSDPCRGYFWLVALLKFIDGPEKIKSAIGFVRGSKTCVRIFKAIYCILTLSI